MQDLQPYQPRTFKELEAFCARICASGMVPPAYRNKPDDAAVAIIYGREIGLKPMTALQFIAVINGRPSVYSDALPGLAMNKGLIIDMQERIEGDGDAMMAICEVTRPNGSVVTQTFSVADAKCAGLWGKQGPWTQYPKRMLQWRARTWAIRDGAPHGLFGMSAEEAQDLELAERARNITPQPPLPHGKSPEAQIDYALQGAQEPRQATMAEEGPGTPADPVSAAGELRFPEWNPAMANLQKGR